MESNIEASNIFSRTNLDDLVAEDAPRPEYAEGSFMYSRGHVGVQDNFAVIHSPVLEEKVKICMMFGFSMLVRQ